MSQFECKYRFIPILKKFFFFITQSKFPDLLYWWPRVLVLLMKPMRPVWSSQKATALHLQQENNNNNNPRYRLQNSMLFCLRIT